MGECAGGGGGEDSGGGKADRSGGGSGCKGSGGGVGDRDNSYEEKSKALTKTNAGLRAKVRRRSTRAISII